MKKDFVGSFPNHAIDPRQKGREWILQFVKAAWDDYNKNNFKFGYNDKYQIDVIKSYAQGRQSVSKYKPLLGVAADSEKSWLNIDWSILPIIPKFRRIAISMMMNNDYNIIATPIDPLAQDETTAEYSSMKTRILMREAMRNIDPELMEAPMLQAEQGDPGDMEELEMQAAYTMKHQMAIEAELGVELVLSQNNAEEGRRRIAEELFDVGYGGWREWIDENNMIRCRPVRPDALVVSSFRNADGSDKFYCGEIMELTIAELRKIAGDQFTEDDYKEIATKLKGQYGNPNSISDFVRINHSYGYDTHRLNVLDIEFYSTNDLVYEQRIDRRGNQVFGRAGFEDRNKVKDKFKRTAVKVVYKAKWIVGTNYMFDFGLCTDMKRSKSSLSETEMSFHIRAVDFYDMKAVGKMQNLLQIGDAIQLSWYKLQNALAQAIPGAWTIDLGALENIALGAGGEKMTPKDLLDMFWQRQIMVHRAQNMMGQATPNKPVEYQANNSFGEVKIYWDLIQSYIETARQILGLNELTDGSTPAERTLTTVAKMAGQSTNNALGDIVYAERKLLEKLAASVVLRLQDVVQRGEVRGYVRSLGTNTVKFIELSEKLALHEFGIIIENRPDAEQRARLLQRLEQFAGTDLLEPEDIFMIENTQNIKQAQQLIAHKVKKRKEDRQREAMQMQQQNGQIQQQSAQVAGQVQQQNLQIEYQLKGELEKLKGEIQGQLLALKLQSEANNTVVREEGRKEATQIQANAKQPDIQGEEVFEPEENFIP